MTGDKFSECFQYLFLVNFLLIAFQFNIGWTLKVRLYYTKKYCMQNEKHNEKEL